MMDFLKSVARYLISETNGGLTAQKTKQCLNQVEPGRVYLHLRASNHAVATSLHLPRLDSLKATIKLPTYASYKVETVAMAPAPDFQKIITDGTSSEAHLDTPGRCTSLTNFAPTARERKKNSALADRIFSRDRRQSAPTKLKATPTSGGSLASRVGVTKVPR